jgi:hypothetical protein
MTTLHWILLAVAVLTAVVLFLVWNRRSATALPHPSATTPTFTPRDFMTFLPELRGRRLFVDFQAGVDGPQTAARLVRETCVQHGAVFPASAQEAEAHVHLHAAAAGRFAFSITDAGGGRSRMECGPRELTANILTQICEFLGIGSRLQAPVDPQKSLRLLRALQDDPPADPNELARRLGATAAELTDALLGSVEELNRKIMGNLSAQRMPQATNDMTVLAHHILVLGTLGDSRAIPAILNALADGAQGATTGSLAAARVRDAAADALVAIGANALPAVQQHLKTPTPEIRQAVEAVYHRLQRGQG